MNWLHRNERGFTLVELLVSLPIAALVVYAATGAIIEVLNSTRASNYMLAYRQVQNAGYWVSHDAIQAQDVDDCWEGPDDRGFPLTLTWTDWDSGAEYVITYTLEDMASGVKYLQRQESVNGVPSAIAPAGEYIYIDIDPNEPTNCVWDEDAKVLTFTVKAQVGQQTATRTYEVKPRPLS